MPSSLGALHSISFRPPDVPVGCTQHGYYLCFMEEETPVQEASMTGSKSHKLIGRAVTEPGILTPGPGPFFLCILQTH